MSRYQHTKGQIKDNAIEALLHDPIIPTARRENKKGKGSYMRKGKHWQSGELGGQWQESKSLFYHWSSAFRRLLRAVILLFQQITNFCQ